MIACPWCEDAAIDLLEDLEAGDYQCPGCGTCVDLIEETVALDVAA